MNDEKINNLMAELKEKTRVYNTDSYPVSIGEIANLYKNKEIFINPDFQRQFRWSNAQRSRLIESILLGIPIPYIYVYQREDGIWELVDGLQRISTVLQFMGELEGHEPLILTGTKLVSNLDGFVFKKQKNGNSALPDPLKLEFKRSKLAFTIIKKESGEDAKFEVFKRLNGGGTFLSDQEYRNCVMVMKNKPIFVWFNDLSKNQDFLDTISLSEKAIEEQYHVELLLRYLSCYKFTFDGKKDVKDFLDDSMDEILELRDFNKESEARKFKSIFALLNNTLGEESFKKYQDGKFKGKFLESAYEVITVGLSHNLETIEKKADKEKWLKTKIQDLWSQKDFTNNMGSGTNAKSRLPKLIPFGKKYFK
jgi:hypothetical protein